MFSVAARLARAFLRPLMATLKTPLPPHVQLSDLLFDALESEGIDPDWFADLFADWKALGPAGEYSSFYFGKDGAYVEPRRGGRMVLRHAHLPPGDPAELALWSRLHRRRRRRTSDACVIYAHDARFGYLLLYIAREPTGHAISDMRVPASARFMNQLADAAEAFIHDGSVVL
ncbi:type II toxin-antitoxin system YafO family toxin [Variovorax sp. GT1P44]|uniref:type II toxin-antitoxin system YafO family toxin n=1 Tax=Variovorax sp. GT1P44 TaxID=3443742 RepID=UPI003F44ECE1